MAVHICTNEVCTAVGKEWRIEPIPLDRLTKVSWCSDESIFPSHHAPRPVAGGIIPICGTCGAQLIPKEKT